MLPHCRPPDPPGATRSTDLAKFGPLAAQCAILLPIWASNVQAATPYVTAGELLEARAQRLSKAELDALLVPGTVSEFMSLGPQIGWLRRWLIHADGSVEIANRDVKEGWSFAGRGTWRISNDSTYCLDIPWQAVHERWCRSVYRMADTLYLGTSNLARDPQVRLGRLSIATPDPVTMMQDKDWIGEWNIEFKPFGAYRVSGVATLRRDGGRWLTYVYGDASRIAPCVGRQLRISSVEATTMSVSFTVEMEEELRGCGSERATLFKIDERTLEGQMFPTWGPVRFKRR